MTVQRRRRASRGLAVCLTLFSCLPPPPLLHGQDTRFWSFLKEGRALNRCRESSAAHQQAGRRLERLDERVQALENRDPVVQLVAELHGLLRTECFLPAAETDRVPNPDSALSLKEWWIDGGGRDWLASFLELPRLGPIDRQTPHIVLPPDPRRTLNLDAHRGHPLSPLLCSLRDAACGAATRGWRRRADEYFESHLQLGLNDGSRNRDTPGPPRPSEIARQCTEKTAGSKSDRYQIWRACIEAHRSRRVALPLGDFTAPMTGWIVVSGRRGHYTFCDTTRAYSLADGTALIHDSCSALVLKTGGHVDRDATNSGRVERSKAGKVPVDNLREAVWLMLLRAEAEVVQVRAEHYPLPPGLTPAVTAPVAASDVADQGTWANTGQTLLTWRWRPDDGVPFVGELTWPDSADAAESHASSLLAVAEEGFVEGCRLRLPPPSAAGTRGVRNLNEVPADAISELDRAVRMASERWRTLTPCRSAR